MQELAKWDSFYVILGSAAGALIGLQFVVLTLVAQRARAGTSAANAAFGTPTIVHFGTVLFLSALMRAPWDGILVLAAIWSVVGVGGFSIASWSLAACTVRSLINLNSKIGFSTCYYH